MSWVLTILGICALVVLHELGHFTVAKAVGMRVERFSLFFPPTIFKVKRGETEYAIGALPLGGYVKISGMNPEELKPRAAVASVLPGAVAAGVGEAGVEETEPLDPEILRRAYYNQAPWKRIVVILAGPAVNIVIAFVLFWAILFSGSLAGASALYNLDPATNAVVATSSVRGIEHGEPAAGVLRSGDRIVAIDDSAVNGETAKAKIEAHSCAGAPVEGCRAATPVTLTVRRGAKTLHLSVFPRYNAEAKRMLLGVEFGEAAKSYGPLSAAGGAIKAMWHATTSTLTGFVHALTSSKSRKEISSIVGITKYAHETVVAGAGIAIVFLGYISLVLAVINLFPFLPLDGGHILWSVAEKVRGKRISLMAMYRFSSVGIVLLLFLVVNGIGNDIGRLGG
jgi:regulator of sigma E protease